MPFHETGGWGKMHRSRTWFTVAALTIVVIGVAATSVFGVKRIGSTYPIQFVFYNTATQSFSTSSESWVDLPGASISVPVNGTFALILGRFTAESDCVGDLGYCSVRTRLKFPDGSIHPMTPNPLRLDGVTDLSFDSAAGDGWESHSIEQVFPKHPAPGTYTLYVQVSAHPPVNSTAAPPSFFLDNWTFTAQAAWE
jgi:hypothetical protein